MVRREGVRIARGCWVAEVDAADLAARCAAALETCAGDTVIAGITAAKLHGLWLPDVPDEIHLAAAQPQRIAKAMTRTQRPEFRAHRRALRDAERTLVSGLPVMTVARVWVDLGNVLKFNDLVAAGDSALRMGVTSEQLSEVVHASWHLRGVRPARVALPLLDKRSESRPESHLRLAVQSVGAPWDVNVDIYRRDGGWLARPDLSLAEARIALEYQGNEHASIDRTRKDITRDTDMRHEGWRCFYYGPAQVFGRPWQIAPELRSLVKARAPHLLRSSS